MLTIQWGLAELFKITMSPFFTLLHFSWEGLEIHIVEDLKIKFLYVGSIRFKNVGNLYSPRIIWTNDTYNWSYKKKLPNLKHLNNSDESKLFTLNYMISWSNSLILKSWDSHFLVPMPFCSWRSQSPEGWERCSAGRKERDAGGKEPKAFLLWKGGWTRRIFQKTDKLEPWTTPVAVLYSCGKLCRTF